jgi:ABC-type lipoprotein export system ATPase subunit
MIFNLKNISCIYSNSVNPVLKINNLEINEGEIVFIIGASGVGKSTILETLGVMNQTVKSEKAPWWFFSLLKNIYSSIKDVMNIFGNKKEFNQSILIKSEEDSFFEFNFEDIKENMLDFWNKKESEQAYFRKKYLSFIFQNTNLFPNLNAEDNVLIAPLLQGDDIITSKNKSRKIFKQIFTKEYSEILNDKKISEMSGGQRQRLAFVRAISTHYKILLADEPTGNLDWANANNLMSHLIIDIRDKKSTAIVVSHDIRLATDHADKIVYIDKIYDKQKKFYYGNISNNNVFVKSKENKWVSISPNKLLDKNIKSKELVKFLQDDIIRKNNI